MSEEQHHPNVVQSNARQKILNAAKALFVERGYKKTTIRQIVERSGVLTGSIYHFFRNKEDIFHALFISLIEQCIHAIEEHCADETPVFKFLALYIVELKAIEQDKIVRDTFMAGYDSCLIFEKMVMQSTRLAEQLFPPIPQGFYHRMLLVKGAMHSCIAEFYFDTPHNPAESRHAFLTFALQLFECDPAVRVATLTRLQEKDALWDAIGKRLKEHSLT